VITLFIPDAMIKTEDVPVADENNQPIMGKMLVLMDPQTGIKVQVPLHPDACKELAQRLTGSKIVTAVPSDIPMNGPNRAQRRAEGRRGT
jgi:hypothetical protein